MMRQSIALLSMLALTANAAQTVYPLRGYTSASSAKEVQWEEKFRQIPQTDNLREYMRRLSARPHHVGSAYDKTNAEWILEQLKSYGLDAQIETFDALFPTPKERSLQLLGSSPFTAKLEEPTLAVDPTSGQKSEQLPTYNAYSKDGDITAPLVYVNYGAPDDYERLDARGISVKGQILIARYGQTWRGIKTKLAAHPGAVGCPLSSDPRHPAYARGES